jgi:hypothetical protein
MSSRARLGERRLALIAWLALAVPARATAGEPLRLADGWAIQSSARVADKGEAVSRAGFRLPARGLAARLRAEQRGRGAR